MSSLSKGWGYQGMKKWKGKLRVTKEFRMVSLGWFVGSGTKKFTLSQTNMETHRVAV